MEEVDSWGFILLFCVPGVWKIVCLILALPIFPSVLSTVVVLRGTFLVAQYWHFLTSAADVTAGEFFKELS